MLNPPDLFFQIGNLVLYSYLLITTNLGLFGWLSVIAWSFVCSAICIPLLSWVTPKVFALEKIEAGFRYAHCRVRNYVESIALYGGEEEERKEINSHFVQVLGQSFQLLKRTVLLSVWTTFARVSNPVVGYALLGFQLYFGPWILSKPFPKDPNELMGAVTIPSGVISSLISSTLVLFNSPSNLTFFLGTVNRIGEFLEIMEESSVKKNE